MNISDSTININYYEDLCQALISKGKDRGWSEHEASEISYYIAEYVKKHPGTEAYLSLDGEEVPEKDSPLLRVMLKDLDVTYLNKYTAILRWIARFEDAPDLVSNICRHLIP